MDGFKLPFEPYDVFGYLISGSFLLAGMELVFGFPPFLAAGESVVGGLLATFGAFTVGVAASVPANGLLQQVVVNRWIGAPSVRLFDGKAPAWCRALFPAYCRTLDDEDIERILGKARLAGTDALGEKLFQFVRFSEEIRSDDRLAVRLSTFLNKYGFCRNVGFAALLIAIAMLAKAALSGDAALWGYGAAMLVLGGLLFHGFLMFFRQYSSDMFTTYGRLMKADPPKSRRTKKKKKK